MTRPEGGRAARVAHRLLRTRWLVRAPIWLYRAGLGVLFGTRLVMVEHIGRASGAPRWVVLEVFGHPDPETYLVVSGFGPRADWYRNLTADPRGRIWVGSRRAVPVRAAPVTGAAADASLARYVDEHPAAWARLRPVVEGATGGPIRRGADLAILALRAVEPASPVG